MSISIEKRTRATTLVSFGAWITTTDAPPYTDTSLIEYRVINTTNIDITDFTNGQVSISDGKYVWNGTGIFDTIVKAVNGNIKAEFDNGRITTAEYANVYLGALQTSIQTAANLLLQEPSVEASTDVARTQKLLLEKQMLLVERQTKGFDDDAKQKLLKQLIDSWAVAYSVSQDSNSIPDSIKVNVIDSITKNAYEALGITKTNDPIGES